MVRAPVVADHQETEHEPHDARDRSPAGRGKQPMLVWRDPVIGTGARMLSASSVMAMAKTASLKNASRSTWNRVRSSGPGGCEGSLTR